MTRNLHRAIGRTRVCTLAFSAVLAGATGAVGVLTASAQTQTQTATAAALLARLPVAAESTQAHRRDLFEHWVDADGDACSTRGEVLIAESLDPVTVGAGCAVTAGRWYSSYDGRTWTDPADVDIDHVVALQEAWQSGASRWTAGQRRDYANDLGLAASLIAVTDEVNAAKGSSDASQWLPSLASDDCRYATDVVLVKYRWDLRVDPVERDALADVLTGACGTATVTVPDKGLSGGPADRLTTGGQLTAGGQLVSANGAYRLVVQADGNAVVYGPGGKVRWNSRTPSAGGRLVLQTDGNLVLYSAGGRATWSSRTSGTAPSTLVMQDDGNLVLYRGGAVWNGDADAAGPAASDTLQSGGRLTAGQQLTATGGAYRALVQGDGNVVVYGPVGAVWSSRTSRAGSSLVQQSDGNAVVYDTTGAAAWDSRTSGAPGARLLMQSDGNLVVYRPDGLALWNSRADSSALLGAR